jgi:GNAT superfamily N-acetyltransferase
MHGTGTVDDFLEHFGVKGMRWGVHKTQPTSDPKTPKGAELVLRKNFKTGDKLSIYKMPPGGLARLFSRVSKNYAKEVKNYPQFNFYDKAGTRVGEGAFIREKDSLHLDWITVKTKHRGKGYASAAMKGVVKYAQNQGLSKLTLEVPGNAPDARHIYEKMGFRSNGKDTASEGPTDPFDGLFGMEYKVPKKIVKHAALTEEEWEEQFAEEFAQVLIQNFDTSGGTVEQSDGVGDFLAHFGIKGMKWGKRKPHPVTAEAKQKQGVKDQVKKTKVGSVSNAQLQAAIRRMQLEQDFKRLAVNEKSAVGRWVSSLLLEAGKREVQAYAAKKLTVGAAKFALKKVATAGVA